MTTAQILEIAAEKLKELTEEQKDFEASEARTERLRLALEYMYFLFRNTQV